MNWLALAAGLGTDLVKIDDFRQFELGWGAAAYGADAHNGREITHTAVQFRDQDRHRGRISGRVDEQRLPLPAGAGKANAVNQLLNLRRKRPCLSLLRLAGFSCEKFPNVDS